MSVVSCNVYRVVCSEAQQSCVAKNTRVIYYVSKQHDFLKYSFDEHFPPFNRIFSHSE